MLSLIGGCADFTNNDSNGGYIEAKVEVVKLGDPGEIKIISIDPAPKNIDKFTEDLYISYNNSGYLFATETGQLLVYRSRELDNGINRYWFLPEFRDKVVNPSF